ncbi:HigA family addiction module antitoxin [Desulfobacula sp.]|uniref:HigA family addiction module antitoxin n=1 Tax=Desulfobacula sp. TaxID=2593537 RepID=UPI002617E8A1|nr:HigA family addiction module antitoxin [Desulfobacula sp.]
MRRQRKPAHPGRILRKHYIEPLDLTITKLAETLNVSRKALSGIINEHKSITPDMALRLSQAFDTTPDLWANLQKNYDMWCAKEKETGWQAVPKIDMLAAMA